VLAIVVVVVIALAVCVLLTLLCEAVLLQAFALVRLSVDLPAPVDVLSLLYEDLV
jgi:hypothetical protein